MIWLLFLIFNHSNQVLEAKSIIIDDFKTNVYIEGKKIRPKGWIKGNEKTGRYDYFVFKEANNLFLRSDYILGRSGKVIYKEKKIKISETPFLSWRWRTNKFPGILVKGEREELDNVATVYAMFRRNLRSYLIKYQWSQINAKNTEKGEPVFFRSKRSSSIIIRPLRCTNPNKANCTDKANEWVTEKINLVDDYIKFFGKTKDLVPDYMGGIGVLSDGDGTNVDGVSADFADFIITSE